MPSPYTVARGFLIRALPWLMALGLFTLVVGAHPARADETAPPSATPPPATDPNAHAEMTPGTGVGNAGGGAPQAVPAEPVVKGDSLVTAAAPSDSAWAKASQAAETKEPEPAALPPGLGRGGEASRPKSGTRGVAVRGIRGPARARALAKPPAAKRMNGALAGPAAGTRSPALYDDFIESDRVAAELERTERFVGRAQRSILLSKNTRAMKLFTSALDFQSDSRDAYKVRQYARAERLTLASRDFADRASRMVGPPREDPDYVEHVLRRTDDALDRAKDVLRTGAGRDAWSRHEELKRGQKNAWRVFKEGDVGAAYNQTLGVRDGVLALLRQLQDLPVPRETAEKAIGGAQAALEQANKELGPKPSLEAVRLVRLAGDYLTKARQSFSRGSYRSALLQAKVVERHVEHAVDVGRPQSG